jgi:hypothetical protein
MPTLQELGSNFVKLTVFWEVTISAIMCSKTNAEIQLQLQKASAGVYLFTDVRFVSFVCSVKLAGQEMARCAGLTVTWTAGRTMT